MIMGKKAVPFAAGLLQFGEQGHGEVVFNSRERVYARFDTSLMAYARHLILQGIDLFSMMDGFSQQGNFVISDIGCGRGNLLHDSKLHYSDKIKTNGFDVIKLRFHNGIDHFVEGDFETNALPPELEKSSQIVISDQVFRYFDDPFGNAFEKTKQLLAPGGVALIDYLMMNPQIISRLYDLTHNPTREFGYVFYGAALLRIDRAK